MFALPSDVSKSAIAALMSSLELGSRLAAASDEQLAAASLRVPHKPLGSAADTAMPATMMLSNTLVHSSGVKSFLLAIAVSNERSVLARYFCCLRADCAAASARREALNVCSIASYVSVRQRGPRS